MMSFLLSLYIFSKVYVLSKDCICLQVYFDILKYLIFYIPTDSIFTGQVMVAVHEIGHNLGLSHASSKDLAYGNPFDWMGNYPDVVGLTYGVGYQYTLGWLREDQIFEVRDSSLGALSHRVIIAVTLIQGGVREVGWR